MSAAAEDAVNIVAFSAMVQLIDGFTNQPLIAEEASFNHNKQLLVPQSRAQGVYVFTNLGTTRYQLDIQAKYFFPGCITMNLADREQLKNAIYSEKLQPAPSYPYPAHLTLLRGQVNSDQPLADVAVTVNYQSQHGKALSAATKTDNRGRYLGRYALALKGKLAQATEISVNFQCKGYQPVTTHVSIQRAKNNLLNVQLKPS